MDLIRFDTNSCFIGSKIKYYLLYINKPKLKEQIRNIAFQRVIYFFQEKLDNSSSTEGQLLKVMLSLYTSGIFNELDFHLLKFQLECKGLYDGENKIILDKFLNKDIYIKK